MGGFKLGKMTLRSLFSKPATVRYPYETREPFEAMRGHVVNDIDACILCGMCVRACPVGALATDRKAGTWSINPYECVQCAYCVSECPKNSLSMAKLPSDAVPQLKTVTMHKPVEEKPAAGAGAGATAGAAKPKPKLTPEQLARVAAAKAKKEAAKKAAAGAEAAKAE